MKGKILSFVILSLLSLSLVFAQSSLGIVNSNNQNIVGENNLLVRVSDISINCINLVEPCGMIDGARVYLYNEKNRLVKRGVTKEGVVFFDDLNAGKYTVYVRAKNYNLVKQEVKVDGSTTLNIYLKPIKKYDGRYDINNDRVIDMLDVNTVFNCYMGKCDVDGNGDITPGDAKIIFDYINQSPIILGVEAIIPPEAYDINDDGKVDKKDAIGVFNCYLGKCDVDGNGDITPGDALLIANFIGR